MSRTSFMKTVKKPWIVFTSPGAGRVTTREGFDSALGMEAVSMDVGNDGFQVVEDISPVRGRLWTLTSSESAPGRKRRLTGTP
jgi:hypothetical protein